MTACGAGVTQLLKIEERAYGVAFFTIISILFGAVVDLKTGFRVIGVFACLLLWVNMMFFSCWILGCSRRTMDRLIFWEENLGLVWSVVSIVMLAIVRPIYVAPPPLGGFEILSMFIGFPMVVLAVVAGLLEDPEPR